jgi:AAA domain
MTRERSDTPAIAGAANTIPINRIKLGKNSFRAHEHAANGQERRDHCNTSDDLASRRARPEGKTDENKAKEVPPKDEDTSNAQIKSGLVTICASEVTPKRVDAIWKDANGGIRLARGEHTMIAGDPDLGKSQIAIAMAAGITTGGDWPCGEGRAPLGSVIILAAEDSVEHTIVPRLIAAGADLERVHFVRAAVTNAGNGRRTFNFQADLVKLKALIKDIRDVALVIIDPVTAYMGKIDSHKNTEVRGVLAPLGDLAQECNVAIASITHFTKRTGSASTKAIDRIIGSIAFIAAPRIGFIVIADPDAPDRRLFLHVKNNISRPPRGLAFRVEQAVVASDEKGDFVGSYIAWESEPVEKTSRRGFAPQRQQRADGQGRCGRVLERDDRCRPGQGNGHRKASACRMPTWSGPIDRSEQTIPVGAQRVGHRVVPAEGPKGRWLVLGAAGACAHQC